MKELIESAKQAIDDMDDYARMADIDPIGARNVLNSFVEAVENIEVFGYVCNDHFYKKMTDAYAYAHRCLHPVFPLIKKTW